MKAVRIQRPVTQIPAPTSAIQIQYDEPIPQPINPGELLIRIKATTVIRDNLTWPELYGEPPSQLGHDFSGVVEATHGDEKVFKTGDAVYGMTHANRGGTWADYSIVTNNEAYLKPDSLSWEQAAAAPLTALTADQALFEHGGLEIGTKQGKQVLITGASGAVGTLLIQFALKAGHHVVAATSSKERNEAFLRSIGATHTIDYGSLDSLDAIDVVVDTVGGDVLRNCWRVVKKDGVLISVDSSSWDFVNEHKNDGLSKLKEHVRALFFIVEPSKKSMERISDALSKGSDKILVSKVMPLEEARDAYEMSYKRDIPRGKIVLTP